MRMTLIILLTFLFLPARCPEDKAIAIVSGRAINYYDPLIYAVTMVESSGGKYLYNAKENAKGPFQIRQCRIDHYNKLTGLNYTLNDCYDYEISKKVFLYFAKGKTYERAARDWNGKFSLTEKYWNKVKKYLK